MLLAIVAAILVFYISWLYLQYFVYDESQQLPTIPPESVARSVRDFFVPGVILLSVAIAIVAADGVVYLLGLIIKKRTKKPIIQDNFVAKGVKNS